MPPVFWSCETKPFFNLDGSRILLGLSIPGINYRHPAFRNPDGTTRIVSIWDQADQTGSVSRRLSVRF